MLVFDEGFREVHLASWLLQPLLNRSDFFLARFLDESPDERRIFPPPSSPTSATYLSAHAEANACSHCGSPFKLISDYGAMYPQVWYRDDDYHSYFCSETCLRND